MKFPGKIEVGDPVIRPSETKAKSAPIVGKITVETPPAESPPPETDDDRREKTAYKSIEKAAEIGACLEKIMVAIYEGKKFTVVAEVKSALEHMAALAYIADLPSKSVIAINQASAQCTMEFNTSSARGWSDSNDSDDSDAYMQYWQGMGGYDSHQDPHRDMEGPFCC